MPQGGPAINTVETQFTQPLTNSLHRSNFSTGTWQPRPRCGAAPAQENVMAQFCLATPLGYATPSDW
jgi:hypothetical protein